MARLGLPLVLLLGLCGCGTFEKKRECAELAKKVNGFIGETKAVSTDYADPERAARESKELASRYRKLSVELGTLGLKSEDLKLPVQNYRKLADGAASALDGAALALERRDLELARTRRLEFDRAAKSEGPLVREINGVCAD